RLRRTAIRVQSHCVTRQIFRAAEAGEDLPCLGEVPVAEARPQRTAARGPTAAAQHAVAPVEPRFRISRIGPGAESAIGGESGAGPFPHIAEQIVGTVAAPGIRESAYR